MKKSTIIIENQHTPKSSRNGHRLFDTLQSLNNLIGHLGNMTSHMRICIDSCHSFITDNHYNVVTKAADIFNVIKPAVIHLNDAVTRTADHHQDIMFGLMDKVELMNFINLSYQNSVPQILETKCYYRSVSAQIQFVKQHVALCHSDNPDKQKILENVLKYIGQMK